MNQLFGHIATIEVHGSVALVDMHVKTTASDLRLSATLLGNQETLASWHSDQAVHILFKETEVALAKNLQGQISLRNRIPGQIFAIEDGQILTRIILTIHGLADVRISSVITTRSAKSLQLRVGDDVEALVKSNEMTIRAVQTMQAIQAKSIQTTVNEEKMR